MEPPPPPLAGSALRLAWVSSGEDAGPDQYVEQDRNMARFLVTYPKEMRAAVIVNFIVKVRTFRATREDCLVKRRFDWEKLS